MSRLGRLALVGLLAGVWLGGVSAVHAQGVLVVPTAWPTIQAAVDAASPGDTVDVLPGTYTEQVTIDKDLTLLGSGRTSTFIRAPATLVPDSAGRASVVKVGGGAQVAMSGFNVSGRAASSGPCTGLNEGIVVIGGSLDLRSVTVAEVRNFPYSPCIGNGIGVAVGRPGPFAQGQVGRASISDVSVANYEYAGIAVLFGSTANITHDSVTGMGLLGHGIFIGRGAVATVTENDVRGAQCNLPEFGCGPDLVQQRQDGGVVTFFAGRGTVIANNSVSSSDVGIVLSRGCCTSSSNLLTNNRYIGVALLDGANASSHDTISGGQVGAAVLALTMDATGTLRDEQISGTSVAPIREVSCCGFVATAVILGP